MSGFRGGRFGGGGGRGGGGRGGRFGSNSDYETDPEAEKFRKLFIGGLSYDTTDQTLKEYYEQWGGEVVDVVVMKDPTTKRSRGFGFVTYSKSSMVDEAQDQRPHKIDERDVECKRAMPRDGGESQELIKKLFCGGLSADISEDSLREYFQQFGTVLKADVIKNKETNKSKGFAFIEFDDYDPVDKCVLKKKHKVDEKTFEVSKATPKDKEGGGGGRRGGRGSGGYGQQGGYGGGYGQSNWGQGGGYGGDDYGYGSGYNDGYGGGPMRGSGYSQRGPGPYGGGYGYGQGGGGW